LVTRSSEGIASVLLWRRKKPTRRRGSPKGKGEAERLLHAGPCKGRSSAGGACPSVPEGIRHLFMPSLPLRGELTLGTLEKSVCAQSSTGSPTTTAAAISRCRRRFGRRGERSRGRSRRRRLRRLSRVSQPSHRRSISSPEASESPSPWSASRDDCVRS